MWPFKPKPVTVEAIREWAGKGKYEKIEQQLRDHPEPAVRLVAATVLAKLDHAMTRLEPLVLAVEDSDERVRNVGLERLGWTLREVIRLCKEPIETPPGLSLEDLTSNSLVAAAIGDDRAMDSLRNRAMSDPVAAFQWQFAMQVRIDMRLTQTGRRITAALKRTAPRRLMAVVEVLALTVGSTTEQTVAAFHNLVEDFAEGNDSRSQAAEQAAQALIRGENASVVMGPYLRASPAAPRESQSSAVTPSLVTDWHYWRCPGCGEVLHKAALGTVWQAGESLETVHGEGACTACGGRFPQVDIYGGRYDFQPPAPSKPAPSLTTLLEVSLVVFREGEDQPADPERYYAEILERKFTGRQVQVKTWRIVGVKDAVRDPDHACVLYARLAEQGQLPRLGDPFDEFQGATSDGRRVVTLFFGDD